MQSLAHTRAFVSSLFRIVKGFTALKHANSANTCIVWRGSWKQTATKQSERHECVNECVYVFNRFIHNGPVYRAVTVYTNSLIASIHIFSWEWRMYACVWAWLNTIKWERRRSNKKNGNNFRLQPPVSMCVCVRVYKISKVWVPVCIGHPLVFRKVHSLSVRRINSIFACLFASYLVIIICNWSMLVKRIEMN